MQPISSSSSSQFNPTLIEGTIEGALCYALRFCEPKDVLRYGGISRRCYDLTYIDHRELYRKASLYHIFALKLQIDKSIHDFPILRGQVAFEALSSPDNFFAQEDHGRSILSYLNLKNKHSTDPEKAFGIVKAILQKGIKEWIRSDPRHIGNVVKYDVQDKSIEFLKILLNIVPNLHSSLHDEAVDIINKLSANISVNRDNEVLYSKVIFRIIIAKLKFVRENENAFKQLMKIAKEIPNFYYRVKALIKICERACRVSHLDKDLKGKKVKRIVSLVPRSVIEGRSTFASSRSPPVPGRPPPVPGSVPRVRDGAPRISGSVPQRNFPRLSGSRTYTEIKYKSIIGELWYTIDDTVQRHNCWKKEKKWRIYVDAFKLLHFLPNSEKLKDIYFKTIFVDEHYNPSSTIEKYKNKLNIFEEILKSPLNPDYQKKVVLELKKLKGSPGINGTLLQASRETKKAALSKCMVLEAHFDPQVFIPEKTEFISEATVTHIKMISSVRYILYWLNEGYAIQMNVQFQDLNDNLDEMLNIYACNLRADPDQLLDILRICSEVIGIQDLQVAALNAKRLKVVDFFAFQLANMFLSQQEDAIKLLRKIYRSDHMHKWFDFKLDDFASKIRTHIKTHTRAETLGKIKALIELSTIQMEFGYFFGGGSTFSVATEIAKTLPKPQPIRPVPLPNIREYLPSQMF